MIASLATFIDWSVLQLLCANALRSVSEWNVPAARWKLPEAIEFLNGPDFLRAESEAARVEFDGPRDFRFQTPRRGSVEENNVVYGRLSRYAEDWQGRPAIILLDGSPAVGYRWAFPRLARRLNRAGFNAATLVAPYEHQRRPRGRLEWDCLEFARSMAQNVAEIRALVGWLLAEGCPSVGMVGFSFGGWTAGLTACVDPRTSCAVLAVPAVRMTRSTPVAWRRIRESLQDLRPAHEAMDTTRLNLTLSTPVIPKENILLIEGIHDLFAPRQAIEELWEKWEQPDIWRLPHGHLSALFARGLTNRVLGWLTPRLEAGRTSSV